MSIGKKGIVDRSAILKKSIESLSNMVFGLALSIGTIALIGSGVSTSQDILYGLGTFAFSFILLIYAWFRYTKIFELAKIDTDIMTRLNVMLLFFVAIEPYLFNLLRVSTNDTVGFTSSLFAVDMAAIMLILGGIYTFTLREYKASSAELKDYWHTRNVLLIGGCIFAFSLLVGVNLRIGFWFMAAIIGFLYIRIRNMVSG